MIRIGYDAKRIFHNFTGLGNYSRTLLRNLQAAFPEHEYHLFSPGLPVHARTSDFWDPNKYRLHQPEKGRFLWRSIGINKDLQRAGIQIFHGLSHELPWGTRQTGIPSVVTMHDLIFRHYPNQYTFIDRLVYNFKFRYACRHADRIIAISESTKSDIIEAYGTDPAKIQVVYQACDELFQHHYEARARKAILEPYKLPETYLLYVGSIIERKGLLKIVQAMTLLPDSLDIPLVVLGNGKAYEKQVQTFLRENALQNRVIFPEVPFACFPAVYQQAAMLIYPSLYEGFGLPVIEALWSGIPVITSDRSSLPEAGGPGAWYVNPDSPEAIAAAIEEVLGNTEEAANRVKQGQEYALRFEGTKLAAEMMAVYQEVLAGFMR